MLRGRREDDMESERAGKALGARRALDLLRGDGPLPRSWHTVGDSRSDYAMADTAAQPAKPSRAAPAPAPVTALGDYACTSGDDNSCNRNNSQKHPQRNEGRALQYRGHRPEVHAYH